MKTFQMWLLLALMALAPAAGAQFADLPGAVRKLAPAVVTIRGTNPAGQTVVGSGFVVGADGVIATNSHVISSLTRGVVLLADGRRFENFTVLGYDVVRDLALVKIAGAAGLPAVELADAGEVQVGEPVFAMGSAKGLSGTVTTGIVSGMRKSKAGHPVIQTDAAINPGNSGGPLANARGQVIGMVTSKLRAAENINFAVPVAQLKELMAAPSAPLSLQDFRQKLAEPAAQGSIASAAGLPARWKAANSAARFTLRFEGEQMFLERDLPEDRRRDGMTDVAELKRTAAGYAGRQKTAIPCMRRVADRLEVTKICRIEYEVEIKSLSASRIELRAHSPVPGQKLECTTCALPLGYEWRESTLVPLVPE